MGCLGLFLPILGLIGFYNGIEWMFYLFGSISALLAIVSVISGELRCFGSIFTIFCWVSAYRSLGSFWEGLIFGSCIAELGLIVLGFVLLVFQVGITAAIAAYMGFIEWIKRLFGKN